MKNIPPNINSITYTSSAVLIGFLLINDLTISEQVAIGNWLMLVGQVLQTNSSQQQVLEDRSNKTIRENETNDLEVLKKCINYVIVELNNLKQ